MGKVQSPVAFPEVHVHCECPLLEEVLLLLGFGWGSLGLPLGTKDMLGS